MPKRGEKAVVKIPFDYSDMRDDQPTTSFLRAGLNLSETRMAQLRDMIRNEMESRGLMGGESLDSKKYVDPHIGIVTTLIRDTLHQIGDVSGAPKAWLEYAIRCIIHIERRNKVRTKEWERQYGQARRSTSSSEVIKRKRSSTPLRERTDEDDEHRRKLVALTLNPSSLIIISTCREDAPSMPFDFEYREICTRVIEDSDNAGFIKADYQKYREIITIERLLKDESDEVYGYFPGTLVWREIMSEFSFRSSLMAQYKHDPQSALRFEIRKARTAPSGLAPVSTKPLGRNGDRGQEHERQATEAIGGGTNDPAGSGSPPRPPRIDTNPRPPRIDTNPRPHPTNTGVVATTEPWWNSYNVQQRDMPEGLESHTRTRSQSPQSDNSQHESNPGEELMEDGVDVGAMFNKIRDNSACEHFSRENIEATCTMFKHPMTKISNKDKVILPGLKQELQIIQAFAIYIIMTRCYGLPTGCLLADEMGFGKTMTAYGWIVVNRWLILMWADIDKARNKRTGKHLPAGTSEKPQAKDAVCPSQSKWPLACPCIDKHPTSGFKPSLGITLVHVPARLILNWIGEFEKFIDPLYPRLCIRLRVLHSAAVQQYVLDSTEAKRCWEQDLESSQYIIICTFSSWSQIERLFSETITWEEEVPGVTKTGNPHRPKKMSETESRLCPAAQIMDEFHETKGTTTGAMRHFYQNTRTNEDCKSLFMSGTPWSQSPAELEGIFQVLITEDWPKHNRLKHACDQSFTNLVASYKRLLQKENEVETSPKLQREMKETTGILAAILEEIMLRRTSDSQWFDGPIIELTEHLSANVTLTFPEEHRRALNRLEDTDNQREAERKREWEEKHPGQAYHRVLNQYFRWSYKQRAVATVPGLATLLERNEDLDFTWSNYTKQKYLGDNNNPFLANISLLTKSCPKLNFIDNLISNLGDMKARMYSADKQTYEDIDVPEKLVIVSTNPVICAIFERALQLRFPTKTIAFIHAKLKQKQRQDIINAFQANSPNSADILIGPMGILGTGYTLTRARQIVICDPDWEEWKGTQAEFRIHRYGQLNPTQAWFLWCLDVPIEATLKHRHESRRKLKQRTERKDQEAARWAQREQEKYESARRAELAAMLV